MATKTGETSPLVYARIAGAAYLITMLLGIFSINFVESTLIVPDNRAETVKNILGNEVLFRIGVASEIIMYVLVILLALALYSILNTVNRNLALLALLWRLGEAIIGGGLTVVSGLIPLLLLKGETALDAEGLQTLVGVFLEVRSAGLDVVLIFIGMGGTVFCYLFFKSGYVPRILAAWGILTYLSMLAISFISVLSPDLPESVKMGFYVPGGLFEIIFGFWLLVKGVNVQQWEKRALESAEL